MKPETTQDDPVLEALEDAISFLADIGAVVPGSYYKARAIQEAQAYLIERLKEDKSYSTRVHDALAALDVVKEGK